MCKNSEQCLSEQFIRKYLDINSFVKNIICLDKVDSTNNYAKKLISETDAENNVVIAEFQYSGRGRMGRTWLSPRGKGLYMSIIIKPTSVESAVHSIPIGASVAVARAITRLTAQVPGIKWPNDIILGGKKVSGILAEAVEDTKSENYIVLGIGVNVSHEQNDFPEDIKNKATSIYAFMNQNTKNARGVNRARLAAAIISEIDNFIGENSREKFSAVMQQYKILSATIGKEIVVVKTDKEQKGKAIDIADDGCLIVEYDTGEIANVLSGEVSVRGVMGYAD